MTATRPMPRRVFLPDWVWYVAVASVFVGSWFVEIPWFFIGVFVLALIQGIYVFHIVRCPTCRGRLFFHQDFIPYTTRYRFQLFCPRCRIIWDTGKISDDNSS